MVSTSRSEQSRAASSVESEVDGDVEVSIVYVEKRAKRSEGEVLRWTSTLTGKRHLR